MIPDWRNIKSTDAMILQIINGRRALCAQTYDEANKKQSVQWEASRLVTLASGETATSILLTGSQHVDLKKREFAYRKAGVVARVYKNPTYTGGIEDALYNLNTSGGLPETKLLTGFTLTDNGVECAAPIYAIGPDTNQTTGASTTAYATNRILEPNTSYLLTFESLDAAEQDVAARIEFYEGGLDLPNGDLL